MAKRGKPQNDDSEGRKESSRRENGLGGSPLIRDLERNLDSLRKDFDHFKDDTFEDYKKHTKETNATKLEVAKAQIAFWGGITGAAFGVLSLILRIFLK